MLCINLIYITLKWIPDEDAKRAKISDSVQGLGDNRQVRILISCSPDPITNSEITNPKFSQIAFEKNSAIKQNKKKQDF